jgi:hypothetical protein
MDNVEYNYRATLVKEIAQIHFTALTTLCLGDNGIESVEGLARVQMPHIESVALCTYTDKHRQKQHHFSGSDQEGCVASPITSQHE